MTTTHTTCTHDATKAARARCRARLSFISPARDIECEAAADELAHTCERHQTFVIATDRRVMLTINFCEACRDEAAELAHAQRLIDWAGAGGYDGWRASAVQGMAARMSRNGELYEGTTLEEAAAYLARPTTTAYAGTPISGQTILMAYS